MVEIFLSKTYPHIFHARYSNTITIEDDKSYWEPYLKNFMLTQSDISFVSEIDHQSKIIDRTFFNTSEMDILDPLKKLKQMVYISKNGIHRSCFKQYIELFPCDYVEHLMYDTVEAYCQINALHFKRDFERVFVFQSEDA